jgi:hypothetical protein
MYPVERRRVSSGPRLRIPAVAVLTNQQPQVVRVSMRTCHGCHRPLPRALYDGYSACRCVDCGRLRILLPTGPLIRELTAWRRENLTSWVALQKRSGVPERSIRRILSGEHHHVRLDVADKLCCAMGQPLGVVYPWE